MKRKIHILGGGVTGSALAYFLVKKGANVNLYEKSNCLGGLSRSIKIEKWNCWNDIGPHIFHSPDNEITSIWKNLFDDLFQYGDYYSAVIKDLEFDKFHSYPISIEGIKEISNFNLKIKSSSITKDEQAVAKNFREMMIAKVGEDLEKLYFRKYPEKLWGIATNKMRSEWAPKRISIRDKIKPFFDGQFVATSKKGAGQVYNRLKKLLIDSDKCEVLFDSEFTGLKIKENSIQSIIVNNKEIDTSDALVISTIPVPILARKLGLNLNLKYRGVRISNWITSSRNILPNNYGWIYFDSNKLDFTRITDYTKMSPESIDVEKGIFTAECPYDPQDQQNVKFDQNKYLEKIKKQLSKLPWFKDKIIDCSSFFNEPYVYPIREKGYEEELNNFNSKIADIKNFWSIGAAGGFEYSDSQILFRKAKDFTDDLDSDIKYSTNRIISNPIKNTCFQDLEFEKQHLKKKVFLISEIGINHNGSIDLAKKLISESKIAGADFVKFQLFNPNKRASVNIRDAFYNERADGEGENLNELFESCHFNLEQFFILKDYADKVGIEMFLSAFDKESVIEASKINSNLIKISSMDLTNIEVWEPAKTYFNKIIASTGMSTLNEVKRSYDFALKDNKEIDISLLHCVSSYPMPDSQASLGRIKSLKKICNSVGYSDHSTSIEIPYTAALLGAEVIEKHFTIDKNLNGPDHIHSANTSEMKKLSRLIKNIPQITSSPKEEISKIQKSEMMRQKKGFYYKNNFFIGHKLKKDDMLLGAPCLGSDTFTCYEMIGKNLKCNVLKNQPVSNKDF